LWRPELVAQKSRKKGIPNGPYRISAIDLGVTEELISGSTKKENLR
jgi:hypothetical protein